MTGYRSQSFDPDRHDTVTFDTRRLIQKILNVAAALTTCPGITASPQTLERRTPLARTRGLRGSPRGSLANRIALAESTITERAGEHRICYRPA